MKSDTLTYKAILFFSTFDIVKIEGSESVNTNGKNTLELVKKKRRYSFAKLRKFTDVCLVGSKFVPPSPLHKNVCDFKGVSFNFLRINFKLDNFANL